ncbi:MAG TPA: GyrI-like domain-containing protein [Pseudonocardiaceae bacterium]|nr:GyrI-like domain-containing protein [Pseudonocardiaceae bacterium]
MEPEITERSEQPYVAITATVTMDTLAPTLVPLMPEVFAWLGERGVAPAGPPFWKYDVVDMEHELVVQVGVAVASAVAGDERVTAGVLPAGRYATVVHVGHPDELARATGDLLAWADRNGLKWDSDGPRWGCRLEEYLTDPAEVPDMTQWETRLAFRLT